MPDDDSATRECPFCKEEVKAAAVRCKHCQAALVPTRPDHEGVCPFCREEINVEALRCKHCQADLAGAKAIIVYDRPASGQLRDPSLGGIIIHARPAGQLGDPWLGGIIVVGGAPGQLGDPSLGGMIIYGAGGGPLR